MIILKYLIIFFLVFFGVILAFMLYSSNGKANNSTRQQSDKYVTASGSSGYFEKKDSLSILNLSGSFNEMGEQYGALAYNQLNEIYQQIVPEYFDGINFRALLSDILRAFYYFKMDNREKDLLRGMTKTSGLSFRQLLSIEMLPMLITLYNGFNGDKLTDTSGTGYCSFLSVWGNQAQTKSMLIARNLDLSTPVTKLDPYYSLVIYKPNGKEKNVASFGFIGFIPGFSWINSKNLFSEYNDGRRSVPGFNFSGYIGLNTAFYAMLDSDNKEEFIQYVKEHPAFVSNFTAIVDVDNSLAIEHAVNNPAGILNGQRPTANFFTNLYRTNFPKAKITMNNCIEKVKDTPSYACVRYRHIEAFLDKHAEIGIDELKTLFSTPLDDGGVYQTGMSVRYPVAEVTNYTLIGELASGQFIYSNHSAKNVWIELDTNHYLHSN